MNGGTHRIVVSRTPGGCSFVYKTSSFFYLLRVTESRIKFTKTCFFLEICFLGNIQNRVWCFNSKIFWCVCMYVFGVVGEFWYWKEEGSEFFFFNKTLFPGVLQLKLLADQGLRTMWVYCTPGTSLDLSLITDELQVICKAERAPPTFWIAYRSAFRVSFDLGRWKRRQAQLKLSTSKEDTNMLWECRRQSCANDGKMLRKETFVQI